MTKIPSAKEYLEQHDGVEPDEMYRFYRIMQGFAKLHVQKFASEHGIFDVPENKTVTKYLTLIK